MTANNSIIETIKQQEQRRCAALVAADLPILREVLSADLVHVHTRGNEDDLDNYLNYVSTIIGFEKVLREDDIQVRVFGDSAVMTGTQINHAFMRAKPETSAVVRSKVMQVWLNNKGTWQLVAFQATSLGELPPAVPREQ